MSWFSLQANIENVDLGQSVGEERALLQLDQEHEEEKSNAPADRRLEPDRLDWLSLAELSVESLTALVQDDEPSFAKLLGIETKEMTH